MRISLDVLEAREAGYAAAMFDALEEAMEDNPPPEAVTKTETASIDGISQSVTTTTQTAGDAGQTTGARRGRKSQAEKDAIAAAKQSAKDATARTATAAGETALRPGDALKGVDAKTLAQALEGMPLVFEGGGTQMRVAPGTPPEEIAEIKARLEAQAAAAAAEEALKVAEALKKDAAAAAKPTLTIVETPKPPVESTGTGMDADLASLFRKSETPPPATVQQGASRFAALSGKELMKEFTTYINGGGGLFWARRVMSHHGLEALDDMTDEQVREALENPGKFNPPAA